MQPYNQHASQPACLWQGRLTLEVALDICQRAAQQECLGDTFDSLHKLAADVVQNRFCDLDAVWADKGPAKGTLGAPTCGPQGAPYMLFGADHRTLTI